MTRRALLLVGGVVLVASADVALAQCAMCRSTLASDEGRQLVSAFRSGILFLLAAPFVAFGTVAFLAIRGQRSVDTAIPTAVRPSPRRDAR